MQTRKYDCLEVAWNGPATLGEGATWDPQNNVLLWVDISAGTVGQFDPITGTNESIQFDSTVGTVAPTNSGHLLVALQDRVVKADRQTGKIITEIFPSGHDLQALRFNDGKCDPVGRFLVGTAPRPNTPVPPGAFYSLERGRPLRKLFGNVAISNGLAWSLDGSILYYIDTPTRAVTAFDYDLHTGRLSNRRIAFSTPQVFGYPDGMTIDEEGMLWIALWQGHAVTRWDPVSGKLIQRYPVPVSNVTSCAFGGPNLDTLYLTSARTDLTPAELEKEPLSGAIFCLTPGVSGLPAFSFAD